MIGRVAKNHVVPVRGQAMAALRPMPRHHRIRSLHATCRCSIPWSRLLISRSRPRRYNGGQIGFEAQTVRRLRDRRTTTVRRASLAHELGRVVNAPVIGKDAVGPYLMDATESRGLRGSADAVVLPTTAGQVTDVLAWCYDHDVPLTPRGGGTGYAGGAVPYEGVVLALGGLRSTRSLQPLQWHAEVESGITTAAVQRLARENGLYYPPDPGAGEQSQIGGNVATNAGGPHAFKYGVTGAWVTGLEVAIAPGTLVRFGGAVRKDVAGYDVRSLMIGSEGTLGIVTSVHLRFIPPPAARRPVVALSDRTRRPTPAPSDQ